MKLWQFITLTILLMGVLNGLVLYYFRKLIQKDLYAVKRYFFENSKVIENKLNHLAKIQGLEITDLIRPPVNEIKSKAYIPSRDVDRKLSGGEVDFFD